jgi:hypothetical protein
VHRLDLLKNQGRRRHVQKSAKDAAGFEPRPFTWKALPQHYQAPNKNFKYYTNHVHTCPNTEKHDWYAP